MKIALEILSTELLKPSTPTPHHLKSLKLSLLDQIVISTYVPVNLFYTQNDTAQHDDLKTHEILTHLRNSLSETVTRFYPFAGRLKDQVSIDCNDEGVLYKEARVGCQLSEILDKPDIALLDIFLPCKALRAEIKSPSLPLLGVQVNVFQCGGIVIGTCFSHLIADIKSISTFLNSWGNTARGLTIQDPDFTEASTLFPPRDTFRIGTTTTTSASERGKFLMKRFLLDEKSLARLKTMAATNTNPNPTRIQRLTALVWERYNIIISQAPLGVDDASNFPITIQPMDVRPRADPPLPNCSIGNLCFLKAARYEPPTERQFLLPELAETVKKSFESVDSQLIDYLRNDQGFEMLKSVFKATGKEHVQSQKTLHSTLNFTSWCNLGIYEVDFGWGRPVWVAAAANADEPNTVLKYSGGLFCEAGPRNGRGIEAWLILPEEQMAVWENDPKFLEFSLLNPSVLNS